MTNLEPLREIVGQERSVRGVCHALHTVVAGLSPPAVGAVHVTCADESELECVTVFQNCFVPYVLPQLKSAHASPMRLANLGGRYEWGALAIADRHYATEAGSARWKLLVVKVNAHVAVSGRAEEPAFGVLDRYGRASACCGALSSVLAGHVHPYTALLQDALESEGRDRLAVLLDPSRVPEAQRMLFAAIASARLQARAAMLDVQDREEASPTLHLIVPCVTLNRPGPDTEIVVGVYVADGREASAREAYVGLGDDPAAYRLSCEHDRIVVSDEHLGAPRQARDHRALARSRVTVRTPAHEHVLRDARLQRIERDVAENKHHHHEHGRWLLRSLLILLAEAAPGPAALLLFANGVAGIHHAFRVHRLMGELEDDHHARAMLQEIHDKVDRLGPDEAQAVLELLLREYRG